ncbi:uncharacterized protein BYT42DRAFT_558220 [Radiomyces spectabilis]|uniref:uncharacterized protein n=1 Tax=Radiomyces spectabilis TaxID=64574 RepID=UPI00221FDC98|nr:uncharacterized protein BYT42DRAFT_558220 [Radiomyces spectabilis]KAI8391834.1 hypothetical protein BYT42DRAFT_558220 [Radiomyces spectabilis]
MTKPAFVIIKAFCPLMKQMRRLELDLSGLIFKSLCKKLQSHFGLTCDFYLTYTDEENDEIVCSSSVELKHAIENSASIVKNVDGVPRFLLRVVIHECSEQDGSPLNQDFSRLPSPPPCEQVPTPTPQTLTTTKNDHADVATALQQFADLFSRKLASTHITAQMDADMFLTEEGKKIANSLLPDGKNAKFNSIFSVYVYDIINDLKAQPALLKANMNQLATQVRHIAADIVRDLRPQHEDPQVETKYGMICDECFINIKDSHWYCGTCNNFHLCGACQARVNHQHEMLHSVQSGSPTTVYVCDACHSDIVGERHTCQVCPDYDLCHHCLSTASNGHPHQFSTSLHAEAAPSTNVPSTVPSTAPSDPGAAAPMHEHVVCNNCRRLVKGVRYKCGHCANYDLCEHCEPQSPSIHDRWHVFLKIRYPIWPTPNMVQPLLPVFHEKRYGPLEANPTADKPVPSAAVEEKDEPSSAVPSPPAASTLETLTDLSFELIEDIDLPVETVNPQARYFKVWRLKNNGRRSWPLNTKLLCRGPAMFVPLSDGQYQTSAVPALQPEEEAYVLVEIQAPSVPGRYNTRFALETPDKGQFGDYIWYEIDVASSELQPSMIYPTLPSGPTINSNSEDMYYADSFQNPEDNESYVPSQLTSSLNSRAASVSDLSDPSLQQEVPHAVDCHRPCFNEEFVLINGDCPSPSDKRPSSDTTPVPLDIRYHAQLTQIHEMGLTYCDQLALHLLKIHKGDTDKVVPRILESLYPE